MSSKYPFHSSRQSNQNTANVEIEIASNTPYSHSTHHGSLGGMLDSDSLAVDTEMGMSTCCHFKIIQAFHFSTK